MSKNKTSQPQATGGISEKPLDEARALQQQLERSQEARRQYEESPTTTDAIEQAIENHLLHMEQAFRERAEQEPNPEVRKLWIGVDDQPEPDDDEDINLPDHGDTRRSIIAEVYDKLPGTPSTTIEKVLARLIRSDRVYFDEKESGRCGDEVLRIAKPQPEGTPRSDGKNALPLNIRVGKLIAKNPNLTSAEIGKTLGLTSNSVRRTPAWKRRKALRSMGNQPAVAAKIKVETSRPYRRVRSQSTMTSISSSRSTRMEERRCQPQSRLPPSLMPMEAT